MGEISRLIKEMGAFEPCRSLSQIPVDFVME